MPWARILAPFYLLRPESLALAPARHRTKAMAIVSSFLLWAANASGRAIWGLGMQELRGAEAHTAGRGLAVTAFSICNRQSAAKAKAVQTVERYVSEVRSRKSLSPTKESTSQSSVRRDTSCTAHWKSADGTPCCPSRFTECLVPPD